MRWTHYSVAASSELVGTGRNLPPPRYILRRRNLFSLVYPVRI